MYRWYVLLTVWLCKCILHCNIFIVCIFMTCSTSYCLVTVKDLWNVYMYVFLVPNGSSQLHKMYQSRCTAKNSWWWAERLPEKCRVVIPIKLEFSASVSFIHKEAVTTHGHTIVKFGKTAFLIIFNLTLRRNFWIGGFPINYCNKNFPICFSILSICLLFCASICLAVQVYQLDDHRTYLKFC